MQNLFVRDALLQENAGNKVRCNVCERRCLLAPGAQGWCRTRQNRNGRLVTTIYGALSSLSANPIEKKPFYHFHPGTYTLTAGSWSCNFGCPWCQNWRISKAPFGPSDDVTPEQFIKLVQETFCQGTSISFNEPVLSLEWSLEVFRLASARGFYNTYVTNGYMTPEAFDLLAGAGLDAMNVDIKGDAAAVRKFCKGVDVEKVWAICKMARAAHVHLELTTLVIPSVNDDETVLHGIAKRIVAELGEDVPWHVTSYHPAYHFAAPPTPRQTLERAWRLGKAAGLHFIYVGNLPGHRLDHTYCPVCGSLLIQRLGFEVLQNAVRNGYCPACGYCMPGIWSGGNSVRN